MECHIAISGLDGNSLAICDFHAQNSAIPKRVRSKRGRAKKEAKERFNERTRKRAQKGVKERFRVKITSNTGLTHPGLGTQATTKLIFLRKSDLAIWLWRYQYASHCASTISVH